MNELSKQQLILVAILISFVTSLSTGIVTVSLMDQAPQGVTRTITQVIQQTVAGVSTGASSTAAVAIAVQDQVADATATVVPSIVRLRDGANGPNAAIAGLGLVVSGSNDILTDKSVAASLASPQAVFADGTTVPVVLTRFQADGDIAFMRPTVKLPRNEPAVSFGAPGRLGSSVWALSGTSSYALSQGIISNLDPIGTSTLAIMKTTISPSDAGEAGLILGSPLFDARGQVIGVYTTSLSTKDGGGSASFYPAQAFQAGLPK